ncbi:alkaline phosphatase family protein [Nitrosovibrio tenuis]|uniref:Predicted pyrophosphatase or phosphodiesterase, AlkP superfamily n=1 Tax=Nitrosovibrio tenuis TaxID=1233 RepID=A0A1H7H7P7_9PROT|nr:alkaline phosphatase family protein [Nitrosovibrio tenuis]SEK46279.1 Predicted pyrophosphatase or phosphodiesterase, AlkP superfamily [Nitrosovibrio tenuis]
MQFRKITLSLLASSALVISANLYAGEHSEHHFPTEHHVRHVLLISVDGMHAIDVENYIRTHPGSALATLSQHAVRYTNASSSKPSDSFPGLLALVTGGSPSSTGVFYDNSYDRTFFAPGKCGGTPGTEVVLDETIDNATNDGIDPAKLPLGPDCKPVFPHQFVKVNTIFEVIKNHGGRTAWADKHPAYDLVNGPSGKGVDDLYTPEITIVNGFDATFSVVTAAANDKLKVDAVINEIRGFDHSGTKNVGKPTILGMNFQAVSVGQKIASDNDPRPQPNLKGKRGGYIDALATPSEVLAFGLDQTDASLGKIVKALRDEGIYDSTLMIISAKHGQGPIDPVKVNKIGTLEDKVSPAIAGMFAKITDDDVALIWLKDQSQTQAVADYLRANQTALNIQDVLAGDLLKLRFNDPLIDSRTPDIIVLPTPGVIFTTSSKKIAEHGGFSNDDTNVALIVSHPGLSKKVVKSPVETMQVAPTILEALRIDPEELLAVRKEKTTPLPALRGDDRE